MAKRRDKSQLVRDRKIIAELYLQGKTQWEIAEALELNQSTISRDLIAIQEEWKKQTITNISELKAQELAKIDNLEREYWQEYRRSQEDREIKTVEKFATSTDDQARKRFKETLRTEEQTGDPRYLSGVQWCINKRAEILGLNSPTKFAPTDPSGELPYDGTLPDFERAVSSLSDAFGDIVSKSGVLERSNLDASEPEAMDGSSLES